MEDLADAEVFVGGAALARLRIDAGRVAEAVIAGRLNAKVKVGALRTEVLDPAGRPIEPFTLANCVPVTSDSTKQPVVWKHGGDLRGLAGKPVRLRFEMTSGELYLYWVGRDESGASRGYVAAGGPGFTESTDTTGA